jgi:hypothetical protein
MKVAENVKHLVNQHVKLLVLLPIKSAKTQNADKSSEVNQIKQQLLLFFCLLDRILNELELI